MYSRGIEDSGGGNGAKHGQVLEPHLRGSVLSDAYATVRPHQVHVALTDGAHADLHHITNIETQCLHDTRLPGMIANACLNVTALGRLLRSREYDKHFIIALESVGPQVMWTR